MKLIMMRHTEVQFPPDRYLGGIDVRLSKEGIGHAKKLAEKIKKENIDVIYSSKLKRAMETADIIAGSCGLEVKARVPGLNEINFGILEGLTRKEAEKKYPELMKKRDEDRMSFRVPQGESLEECANRALPAIKKIVKDNEGKSKTVLVVMHGMVMRIFMTKFTGKSIRDVYKKEFDYGCRMVFEVNANSDKFEFKDFIHG